MAAHNFYIYGNIDFAAKNAGAKRMLYYAKALADQDHIVYLISSCSFRFTQNDFIEVAPNILVLENKKLSNKSFFALVFLRRLYRFSKSNEGQASFIVYPQSYFFLELFTVLYLIFLKKRDLYYELNEVKKYSSIFHVPQSIWKWKYAIKTLVFKTKFIVMDNLMSYYDGLICISTNIEVYGKRYNKNTLRIPILTNPDITIKTSGETYTKNDFFNIGFSGSIVPSKENLFEFVEIVKQANKINYKVAFNLCGTISKKDYKILIGDENNESTIKYYGNLNEKELSTFLNQQDILVIPRGYNLQNKYGFSTKLSDYLNHQKVILITDISDNRLYIKDGVNGFVVPPNNKKMMYEKLIGIIENFNDIEESIIANAYITSKDKFDYRLYKESLQTFLKSK